MNRLLDIGFVSVGHWILENKSIKFKLISQHTETNVLYSFISNGEIKFIGKTKIQLSQRMYGYQNPGPSQTTNTRVNALIKELLSTNQPVDILVLADNGLLKYGDFKINLAAGLEDTLIYEINPIWNLSGRSLIPVDSESEKPELAKEPMPISSIIPILTTFYVTLGQAYYNQGFFNIVKEYSDLIGSDNAAIDIQLGVNPDTTIHGYINRTANRNGTPRIMGGRNLRQWIQSNFRLNDNMKVDIISPVSIRAYKE